NRFQKNPETTDHGQLETDKPRNVDSGISHLISPKVPVISVISPFSPIPSSTSPPKPEVSAKPDTFRPCTNHLQRKNQTLAFFFKPNPLRIQAPNQESPG